MHWKKRFSQLSWLDIGLMIVSPLVGLIAWSVVYDVSIIFVARPVHDVLIWLDGETGKAYFNIGFMLAVFATTFFIGYFLYPPAILAPQPVRDIGFILLSFGFALWGWPFAMIGLTSLLTDGFYSLQPYFWMLPAATAAFCMRSLWKVEKSA